MWPEYFPVTGPNLFFPFNAGINRYFTKLGTVFLVGSLSHKSEKNPLNMIRSARRLLYVILQRRSIYLNTN